MPCCSARAMEDYIYHEVRSLAICHEAWPTVNLF